MVIFSAKEGYSKLSSALTASSYDQYTFEYRWERESLHPMAISALNKEHIISSRALMMSSYGHIVFENRLGEKSLQYSAYCDGAGLIWESPGNCNASVKYCQRCVDDTGTVLSDVVYCNDTSGQLACKPKSSYNSLYFRITSDGFTNCVDDQNGLLPLRMAPCGNASAKNQYFSFAQLTGQISGYHFNLSLPRQCIDVGNLTTGILYKPCEKVSSSGISNQIFVQEDNGLFQAVAKQQCLKRSSADSSLTLAPCNASDPLQQFDTYVGEEIPHLSPLCDAGTYELQWESPGNCHADTTICQTCSEEGAIAYCDDTSGIIVCEKLTSLTDYYFTMTSDDAMNCVDDSNGTQPLQMAPCGGVNKTNQLFSFAQLTGQISGYHYDLSRPRLCLDFSDLTAGILYKPCEDISSTAISNQIFVEENRLFQAVVEQQCLKRSLVDSSLTLAPCNASDPLEQFHTYAYCRPGEYSPGENQCTLCPAGTYSNSSGATTCEFCQPGTYSQRNSTSCTPCHLNNANGCLPYIVKAIYGEKEIGNGYSVVCNSGTYAAVVSVYLNEANFVDNFVLGCSDGNLPYLDSPNQFSNNYFDAFNSDLSGIFAVGGYWLDSMFFYIDGSWQNYGGDSGKDLYVRICGGNDVIAGFTNVYYNSSNSYIASFDIICSTPCPAGRYGASSCDLCPAGSYSYYGSYECTLCPAGTYSSATGADSIDACVPCPSGTFSSAVGATSISSCTDCPTGSYPTTNATTCISCDKNKAGGCLPYTISGVHGQEASVSSYATCNNGTYAEAIVIFTDADITFVAGLGVFCSDGFYNDITFSSSSRYQLAYNADSSGFTNVSGKAGLYVDAMVLEVDGQLIPFGGIGGASPYFTSCSGGDVIVGFTNVHEDSDQFQYLAGFDIVCGTPCPAGRYGASACDLCPAGTYSGNGSYSCTPCPAGNYSSAAGQSSCLACPSGTYSVTTGANSLGACLACPSGANTYTRTYIVRKYFYFSHFKSTLGPSSLCILSSTVSSTLIPTALPMAAAPSSEYLVRYLVNHTFTGNTLPSYDAFASALTAPMDVTTGQIGILSIAFSPYGQLNTMRFGQTIIIIWELTYLNGAIPSLGIVTQRVNNLDLTSLSLKFPIANVILDEGPSVSIFRNSNFIRVNFDQYRSLQSSIIANYSFNAFWSVRSTTTGDVPLAGVRLTQSSSMVFNASAAAQGVAFPLVVNFSSAVFGHNETYIIRLETSSSLYASTIIYDEVKALLYVPPSGGWLLVHPNQVPTAVPLSSITPSKTILFDLSAPNWIDSLHKGPLLYQFFFSVGSSSPLLALADRSFSSTMTTELPRGQNLTIVVVVQTLSGATSTATNYTNPVALQNLTLESFSASMLRTTSSIGPLNNFLTALNNVNSTLLLPEGFACNHSTDCLTGLCQDRSCIATSSQKLCPSNSTTSSCSGHGNCVFLDSVGNTVSSCASNATNCMAFCRCDVDYGGQGCERHVNVSMLEDEIRGSACATLGNLLQNSAASSYDAVSTLKVLYQPGRISSQSSISSCMEAFQTLLKNLTLGRGVNDTLIALEAMSIISSIGESHFYAGIQGNGTNASITQISTNALLDAFASNLLINTVVGQSHNLNAGYLQLSIKTDYLTSIAGSAVSPSNVSLSRITFDGNGLNDCYAQGGHAKLVLSEWTLNPYPNSESLRTNLLGMSAPDPSLPPSLSSGHSSVYYMTLAFTSQQNLSLALPAEGASNQTVPECTTRVNGIYQPCNCNLSSYTNFSAVFVCGVRENLCPSISSSATNAPRHQALNPSPSSDSNALNIREYSALLGSASAEISSTLLFRGSLDTNVLAVVLFLLLSLIAGLIFFSRWDAMDRRVLLYVPKVQRKSMSMLDFKEIETFRKGLDAAFLAGALPPSVFMDEVALSLVYIVITYTYDTI